MVHQWNAYRGCQHHSHECKTSTDHSSIHDKTQRMGSGRCHHYRTQWWLCQGQYQCSCTYLRHFVIWLFGHADFVYIPNRENLNVNLKQLLLLASANLWGCKQYRGDLGRQWLCWNHCHSLPSDSSQYTGKLLGGTQIIYQYALGWGWVNSPWLQ